MNASRAVKITLLSLLVIIIVGALKVLSVYNKAFSPNVTISVKRNYFFLLIQAGHTIRFLNRLKNKIFLKIVAVLTGQQKRKIMLRIFIRDVIC